MEDNQDDSTDKTVSDKNETQAKINHESKNKNRYNDKKMHANQHQSKDDDDDARNYIHVHKNSVDPVLQDAQGVLRELVTQSGRVANSTLKSLRDIWKSPEDNQDNSTDEPVSDK